MLPARPSRHRLLFVPHSHSNQPASDETKKENTLLNHVFHSASRSSAVRRLWYLSLWSSYSLVSASTYCSW